MSRLKDVMLIDLPSNIDSRGILTAIEGDRDIPFPIHRIFYMHHIIDDRGGHAHRDTDQVIIAMAGRFSMDVSDGENTLTFDLHNPAHGVYVPRMIFIRMYGFSKEAVCCVLASTHYDIKKSIRSWEAYQEAIRKKNELIV